MSPPAHTCPLFFFYLILVLSRSPEFLFSPLSFCLRINVTSNAAYNEPRQWTAFKFIASLLRLLALSAAGGAASDREVKLIGDEKCVEESFVHMLSSMYSWL